MRLFNEPLNKIPWMKDAQERLEKPHEAVKITGCAEAYKLNVINKLAENFDAVLILAENNLTAKEMYEDYALFEDNVYYYPAKDLIFYQSDINGKKLSVDRMKVVGAIMEGSPITVITTLDALMTPMMNRDRIEENTLFLSESQIVEEDALRIKLANMGYERVGQVTSRGEFSQRGGIIDVFCITEDNPVRIEFWGDNIESIRYFDVESQRSIEKIDKIMIMPASEMLLTRGEKESGYHTLSLEADKAEEIFRQSEKYEYASRISNLKEQLKLTLLETDMGMNLESYIRYFYDTPGYFTDLFENRRLCVFVDEPDRVVLRANAVFEEFEESMKNRLEKGYILPGQSEVLERPDKAIGMLARMRIVGMSSFVESGDVFDYSNHYLCEGRSLISYNGNFKMLVEDLKRRKEAGFMTIIVSPSRTRAERLARDLTDEGVIAAYTEDEDKILQPGEVYTFYGRLKKGFEYKELGYAVISETDIFGTDAVKKKKKPRYGGGKKISGYDELKVGDYVIHENNGLGIYRGIEKLEVEHVVKDYMKIEYKDGGNLYVLASNFDAVQFYAGRDAKKPRLNKLGTQEWSKTKAKVEEAVGLVAKELVHLYAVRSEKHGYKYGEDTVWQKEFEEMFPYEETPDQKTAIDATKDDMESDRIMDRLICGDVGFGKTEVAIRAAFKAVQEGKQVAYLVPTTILAQQHYTTFSERMKNYPVKIRMLSRFCTSKEIKDSLDQLKKGLVDIVIGTHRLLSKDVVFNDLGLLIIDEEQRFGVSHKEKIKLLKENVDVLTLTATPIPRTLHMSLIGIRDMSLLEEAPQDRQPIQTYVMEYNEEIVREAINREVSRNGQVYYVYNRVEDIDKIAAQVSELVPNARVSFAHGQMNESELEVVMMEFVNHEIDVLVSTTIIETGLDIPNVNTMIIHDSDSLGLSQLYQLRGRVGRSNRTSFAFLMYRRNKLLKEVAEKRLNAIKEFTELGSGFKIAMRDLEIRGAGNLLGKQQHGHIEAVGYDLYCKMLEEAVCVEQGKSIKELHQAQIDLDVDAYIPASYIVNESQKLDMYRRIATIENEKDRDDMLDEVKDRFGEIPREVMNLLMVSMMKQRATSYSVEEIRGRVGRIRVVMDKKAPVTVENIPYFLNEYAGTMKMIPKANPEFILTYSIIGLVEKDEELLINKTNELLDNMKVLFEPAINS